MDPIAIYLEMDGMLADFDRGSRQVTDDDALLTRPSTQLGKRLNGTSQEVWRLLESHPDFYLDLPLVPGATQLYEVLRAYRPLILTTAPKPPGADYARQFRNVAAKKRAWCRKHFPWIPYQDFICTTSSEKLKYLGYRLGRVQLLIDPDARNCARWKEDGGVAIQHTDVETTISEFHRLLRCLGLARASAA